MYKKKKHKFAILVDEVGRKKQSVSDLLDILSEEYPFLKQANRVVTTKRVAAAKKGDVIIFGFSNKYDYRLITEEDWEEYSIHRRTPLVELSNEWEEVEELLEQYAASNYSKEFEIDYDRDDNYRYCRSKKNTYDLEDLLLDDIYYVQQQPKKRKTYTKTRKTYKKKNNLKLEEVSVHHNFVKVGWDVFDIFLNNQNEEYVKVDGNTYWIDRDSSGGAKLSVE